MLKKPRLRQTEQAESIHVSSTIYGDYVKYDGCK